MKKRVIIAIIFLIILFGGIFGYRAFINYEIGKYMSTFKMPAVSVSAAKSKSVTWHPFINSIGSLKAVNGINVSAEVSGIVSTINFKSGQFVKKGQVLFTLQHKAEAATLKSNIAKMELAEISYRRAVELRKSGANSASNLDTAAANLAEAKAMVDQARASLNYKIIRAPFSGMLGISALSLGQFLSAGTAATNLQTIAPIYADFNLPEQDISKIKVGQKVELSTGAYPTNTFNGKVLAVDASINESTKSIAVRAIFTNKNAAQRLVPGMFVSLKVIEPQVRNVVVVPKGAITYTLYGNSVYVVTNKKQKSGKTASYAKQVYITTGKVRGDYIEIVKGLKAGVTVVTAGQIKLHPGSLITVEK